METLLEIGPFHSSKLDESKDDESNNQSNINLKWLSSLQSIINKLTKADRKSHKMTINNDDWDIPFERIQLNPQEFQRSGSQGDVFYGRLSNSPVAVKRVKDVSLTKIKHLRELNHKNVIKFRGVSQSPNYFYIIMEWCQYGTIQDHLHSGRQLSSTILSNFAQQIASGMRYLHSKNIIHRDLKPSNILLTHNDVLKISDFGTHKVLDANQPVMSVSYAGTQAYMAPEVIRGEPYSFPVDIWSYGVVLWEIIIGDEPFKNLERSAVVWAVGNNSFHLPIPNSFPDGFKRILNGCWKAQPNERLTFQQICIILKGAIHEIERISKERWLPLQAGWKRDARDELEMSLQFKPTSNECQTCTQKHRALEEEQEKLQKRIDKNNNIYLQLQECCMQLQRDRDYVLKERESITRREQQVDSMQHEYNVYKEKATLLDSILEELSLRNISLNCLQDK